MSAFLELSDAIHFYILSFCDADALFQCSHVKRSWYIYLEGEEPWKTLSYYNMCRALFSLYSIRSLPLLSPQNNNNKIDKNKNSADFDPFDFSYDFSGTYERQQQQQQEEEDRARHAYHSVFYLHENSDKDDEQSTIFHYINVSAPYYNDPSHSPAEGYPRLVCPVPPRASSASTGRDFSWDTLYRQDGGSGGAREFYMRFLRHLKFNILFSNAAKGAGIYNAPEEEETNNHHSHCYFCNVFRRSQKRWPRGCQTSFDNRLIISENGFCVFSRLPSNNNNNNNNNMNIPQNKWHTILLSKIKIYNERTQTYYKTGAGGRRVLLPEEERYQHQASHEGEGLFLAQGRIPLYFRYEVLPEEDNNEENENNNNNKGMAVFGFVELSQSAQYEIRKNEQLHLQNNNNENNNNNDDVDEEIESWFTANVNAVLEKENGPLYAEHNDNTNHFNKKQSTGGVYVGDLPDSYGYRSDGMLCSGDGSYLLGPSLQHHDILSLIFCLEEDYVEVGINGSRVGTMGTDIFSEGQVYVPAISLRGAGVTLLPYRLTDREEE